MVCSAGKSRLLIGPYLNTAVAPPDSGIRLSTPGDGPGQRCDRSVKTPGRRAPIRSGRRRGVVPQDPEARPLERYDIRRGENHRILLLINTRTGELKWVRQSWRVAAVSLTVPAAGDGSPGPPPVSRSARFAQVPEGVNVGTPLLASMSDADDIEDIKQRKKERLLEGATTPDEPVRVCRGTTRILAD